MAIKGTINGTTSNDAITSKITWSAVQSTANNYSDVTATLTYNRTNDYSSTGGTWRGSITINGATKSGSKSMRISYNSNTEAISATVRVYHNDDGKKSITISADGAINGTSLTSTSCKETITLDQILRQAVIITAPDFSDEDNPTITYSNPAGKDNIDACISLTGSQDDVVYRKIDPSGNTYTFELTEEERNVLRNATLEGSASRTVKFYVRTALDGGHKHSSIAKTFTVINCAPTLDPLIEHVDSHRSMVLTDDPNKIIKGFNEINVSTNATALKGASIVSHRITCGTDVITSESGTFTNVESNVFEFSVTDNRGQTMTHIITKELVDYIKLSCGMDITAPNAEGELTFTIKGNFFGNSFGAVNNDLAVEYRCAVIGSEFPTNDNGEDIWINAPVTSKNSTSYTAEVKVTGLNYKLGYVVQARAADSVYYDYINATERRVRAIPIFDWGETDFNFNVPVTAEEASITTLTTNKTSANTATITELESERIYLNGKDIANNRVLWSSSGWYMGDNQTITLPEKISDQVSGIVLVFSYYDDEGDVSKDHSINTFFVSKKQIEIFSECGHTFIMGINAGFSSIAAKYLHFTDTTIYGHSGNVINGTNSGITFNNRDYVLRYVIGV